MRKTIVTILLLLVVVIAGFLAYVALQPDDFRYSRSTAIAAQPSAVFPQVNDFHNWEAWSPWAKLDPNAKNTFDGPASGTGASFAWAGNHEVGEGRMTITESRPNELIRIRLDFEKPFKGTNTAEFTFTPEGNHTIVTWSMFGTNDFLRKAIGALMNCEKMMNTYFDKGLAQIKAIVESDSVPAPAKP